MFRQKRTLVEEIKTPTSVQADWEKAYKHKSSIGVSAANAASQTPCIIAVINQRLDVLTWLLEAKHPEPYPWSKARTPKINHQDKDQMSALAHAVNYSSAVEKKDEKDTRWEIVTLLLKHGADITPTIDNEHPVCVAIRANNLKFINYYLTEICPRLDTSTWLSVQFTKMIQDIFKYAAEHFNIPLLDLLTKDFSEHLDFTKELPRVGPWVKDAIISFSPLGVCLTAKALPAALYLIENQKIKNYHLITSVTYYRGEMYYLRDQCAIKECFTLLESDSIAVDFVYRFSLALLTHVPTYFCNRDQAREALKLIFANQKLTEEQKLTLSRLFINQCEKLGGIDVVIEPQKMEELDSYYRFNFFEAASNFPTLVEFLSQQKWGHYTRSDALEFAINKRNFPLIKLLYEQGSWISNDTIERLNKKTIYDGETYVRLFAFVKAWDFLMQRKQFPDALDLFKQEIPKLKDEDLFAFKKAWEIHFKVLPEEIIKFFSSDAVVWHQPEPSAPVHGEAKLEAPPSYEASISAVPTISPGGPPTSSRGLSGGSSSDKQDPVASDFSLSSPALFAVKNQEIVALPSVATKISCS